MPNEQYVISRELLNEAISGLVAFGQSATKDTVYKLSTLSPLGYEKFSIGTKVRVTRRDNSPDSPYHTFTGTIEAIHSFGPAVNDMAGNTWNVKWDQISTLNPTPE